MLTRVAVKTKCHFLKKIAKQYSNIVCNSDIPYMEYAVLAPTGKQLVKRPPPMDSWGKRGWEGWKAQI